MPIPFGVDPAMVEEDEVVVAEFQARTIVAEVDPDSTTAEIQARTIEVD